MVAGSLASNAYKISGSPTYGVYSVNSIVTYTNITAVAVANIVYKDLGTTCTTNGLRMYVPL